MKFIDQLHILQEKDISSTEVYFSVISSNQKVLKQLQEFNFPTNQKNQININKLEIKSSIGQKTPCKIEDLVKIISQTPKSQIGKINKLIISLAFSLSLQPKSIDKIYPDRSFISNFNQFVKKLIENQENSEENQPKIKKIHLNSLLFILMLLICEDKVQSKNPDLRNKLFEKNILIKNLLSLTIYKHRKISKLYGIMIVYIYKNCSVSDVKRLIVQSIVKNMKHLDHQKTQLNLVMILNELKSSHRLKGKLFINQETLLKLKKILLVNKSSFQSIYVMKYILYLYYEHPNISKIIKQSFQINFEITQNIKKLVLSSNFYSKNLIRYLNLVYEHRTFEENLNSFNFYLYQLNQLQNSQSLINLEKYQLSKWRDFLIQSLSNLLRTLTTESQIVIILQKQLIDILLNIVFKNTLNSEIFNKVKEILMDIALKLQIRINYFSIATLNFIHDKIRQLQSIFEQEKSRRQNIENIRINFCKGFNLQSMQLE